jgi:hypothetical protein
MSSLLNASALADAEGQIPNTKPALLDAVETEVSYSNRHASNGGGSMIRRE